MNNKVISKIGAKVKPFGGKGFIVCLIVFHIRTNKSLSNCSANLV